ncbi:GNAT family N-acetyltransferase [Symbioplanes lichenis]|uniref:GNAT family N-acetyltransferase n=1 Tax=Symbioplanes lichenis TaxID=1629072 RepID=UPI0027390890|nr:GNAT family N-acetyltransferase [Actinoplanes lichenis]
MGEPDFTPDDIREGLTGPNTDMSRDCWVALDTAGAIVGWGYPGNADRGDRDFLEVYVWPGRGEPALRPLLDLLLARAAERGAAFGHDTYHVRAGAVPTEQAWIATLTDAGFSFVKQHARMTVALDALPAAVDGDQVAGPAAVDGGTVAGPAGFVSPGGVTVRPVLPSELRRFHATIEEAFRDTDHHATDYETWLARVHAETSVSWDEWLVGLVDGEWAGVLQSSDSSAGDGEGWVRSLAVLRAYRRRGVGEALLRRAFAIYAAKGRSKAGLGVDMANPTRAARLYHRVGMTPLYRADIYQRTVQISGVDVRAGRGRTS